MQQVPMLYPSVGVPQQTMQQQQALQAFGTGAYVPNSVNQMPVQGVYNNPGFR